MRARYCLLLIVTAFSMAASSAVQAAGAQDDDCAVKALAKAHGQALFTLDGTATDTPTWTSTISFDVPKSWSLLKGLLNRDSDQLNKVYGCVPFYLYRGLQSGHSGYSEKTTVEVKETTVTITTTGKGEIFNYDFEYIFEGPWRMTFERNGYTIAFNRMSTLEKAVAWDSVTVSADGFKLTSPDPLPKRQQHDAVMVWQDLKPSKPDAEAASVQLRATPNSLADMKLRIASAYGNLEWLPQDVWLLLLAIVLLLLLLRERRDNAGMLKRLSTTWWLTLVATTLAAGDVVSDVVRYYEVVDSLCLGVVAWSAIKIASTSRTAPQASRPVNATRAARRRSLVTIALALVAILLGMSPGILSALGVACALYLVWTFALGVATQVLQAPPFEWKRNFSHAWSATVLTTFCLAVGFASGNVPGLGNAISLARSLAFLLLPFAVVGMLATGQQHQLLPDRRQRRLLGWLVGVVLLFSIPNNYLGLHVAVASAVGLATTLFLLRATARRAILRPLTNGAPQPTVAALQDPESLAKELLRAGERLDNIALELKALEKKLSDGAISATTYDQRRRSLQKEIDDLRRVPPTIEQPRLSLPQRLWKRLPFTATSNPAGVALTKRISPVDVALSLGPKGDLVRNGLLAATIGAVLAAIPATYFTWKAQQPLQDGLRSLLSPSLSLLAAFGRELLFWWLVAFLLGAAWSSLYGRRGSTRALQVWLCVAVPIAIHGVLNWAFDQQPNANVLFRGTLALVILLVVGLTMDLSTLRLQDSTTSGVGIFRRYYNFNRVIATVTLLVPLATAGLTLWQQIDSGVLKQQAPSTGIERSTDQQKPGQPTPGASTTTTTGH
jgi:Family of unknown function (DUF6185)